MSNEMTPRQTIQVMASFAGKNMFYFPCWLERESISPLERFSRFFQAAKQTEVLILCLLELLYFEPLLRLCVYSEDMRTMMKMISVLIVSSF